MKLNGFTTTTLWLWFYVVEFAKQEKSLWEKPLDVDDALVLVRITHLGCVTLGFAVGIVVSYPQTSPPAILGAILIAFIGGAVGYYFVKNMTEIDEANELSEVDTGNIFGMPIYRPRRLFKQYGVQEEQTPSTAYEARPWCDLAAWFILASLMRVVAFLVLHKGGI